jgi:maltooligosyltrehalose trehalohydrolase
MSVPLFGASIKDNQIFFRVWAPEKKTASVVLYDESLQPYQEHPLTADNDVFVLQLPRPAGRVLYKFRLDEQGPWPDPWSRAQPFGVHGPSEVIEQSFSWSCANWKGRPLHEMVIYEIHVGAATREGTFEALIAKLSSLASLGITAIELMPVASFPGRRGWGYDGVSLFAPQESYGGPVGLKRLVDAAHAVGIAVLLDVVYNHLGPDGNYLSCYSQRYFTDRHKTPWGDALNLEEETARQLLLQNVQMWIREYRIDGLRLDATHEIFDERPEHILQELVTCARQAAPDRHVVMIAEDNRNESRLLRSADGFGLDGVWADDFHHQLRRAFARDHDGYFADFTGNTKDIAATLNKGWFFEGQHSNYKGGPRGTSAEGLPPVSFIHCIQNHDQIGNRALGDRLSQSVSAAAFRAMSTLLLLSPYTPLLFMGQEWGAKTPFLYFTEHHEELGRNVTEGRRKEFAAFAAFQGVSIPDPQAEDTFLRSKLDEPSTLLQAGILRLYRSLLSLRATHPALRARARGDFEAAALSENTISLRRRGGSRELLLLVNISGVFTLPLSGMYRMHVFTEAPTYGGATEPAHALSAQRLHMEGPVAALLERQ